MDERDYAEERYQDDHMRNIEQADDRTPWERVEDSRAALHAALAEFATAYYEHNRFNRMISPVPAYQDAAERTETLTKDLADGILMKLQNRAAQAR